MKSLVWILFLGLVTVVHGQQLSMMSYNIKLDYPKEEKTVGPIENLFYGTNKVSYA